MPEILFLDLIRRLLANLALGVFVISVTIIVIGGILGFKLSIIDLKQNMWGINARK